MSRAQNSIIPTFKHDYTRYLAEHLPIHHKHIHVEFEFREARVFAVSKPGFNIVRIEQCVLAQRLSLVAAQHHVERHASQTRILPMD